MNPIPWAVVVPLLGAAIISGTRPWLRRWVAELLAIASAAGTAALCALLLVHSRGGLLVYWFGGHVPRGGQAVGIAFAIDPFGAGIALLAAVLVLLALIFSDGYFDSAELLYYVLMLVFLAGMVGLSLSGDLFNMFVFFEVMSVSAFALTAHHTEEKGPVQGAFNFAVVNTAGAYLMLVGIALVYGRTGALNLAEIGEKLASRPADELVAAGFVLIATGFLVKGALVPFHFWLADAHAMAPSPVCTLFSGVMVELGLYGLARIYWTAFSGAFAPHGAAVRGVFVTVGVFTAVLGAVMAFRQRHLKRLLAFSSIAHMGLFTVGFGLLAAAPLAGVALYVLGHGMAKAALFFVAGVLLDRFGSVDEEELRGRARGQWALLAVGVVGALALMEVPPLLTAAGAERIAAGAGGYKLLVTAVEVVCAAIVGAAVLRAAAKIFFGVGAPAPAGAEQHAPRRQSPESAPPTGRHAWLLVGPPVLCALAAIALRFAPGLEGEALSAARRFTDREGYATAVLRGEPMAVPKAAAEPLARAEKIPAVLSTAAALALAGLAMRGRRGERALRILRPLELLHSGHAGDYVAWLAFGCAAIGAVFWAAVA